MFIRPAQSIAAALGLILMATASWAKAPQPVWVPAFYAAPEPSGADAVAKDITLRQMVRLSVGGTQVRIRLSNAYGDKPLRLDDVRIARRTAGAQIDPASNQVVTFNGATGVVIAPGAYVISDVVDMQAAAGRDLAISVYLKDSVALNTVHDIQRGALYVAHGPQAAATHFPVETIDLGLGKAFPFVTGVEVVGAPTATIIAFGDSITDGYGITPDTGRTWPDVLNARLKAAGLPASVINAGISGNRMLHHGTWARFGTGALARFDRDVLAQPNGAAVIVLIGINDLGHALSPDAEDYVSAKDLIGGLKQMALRARAHNIKIYVATLTPFKGTVFKDYYSDHKETERQILNGWLRQSQDFDGVFDFDKALEDPNRPGWLKPEYDLGDHLHPNDAGAAAMANAIPLTAFEWMKVEP